MKLSEIFPIERTAAVFATGEITEVSHPDGATKMWRLESKIPSCEVAARMAGIVFRNGEILARPIREFHELETKGFPETRVSTLGLLGTRNMLATSWIDGFQAVLYQGLMGLPFLATKDSFQHPILLWANSWYRNRFRTASWPQDYTPNFVLVHPSHVKIIQYAEPQIFLVSLVHVSSGDELSWWDTKEWGKHNDIRLVDEVKGSMYDFPHDTNITDKGVVMRWDQPGVVLRVGVRACGFRGKTDNTEMLEGITPDDICDMLAAGTDPLEVENLPDAYIGWVKGWTLKIRDKYTRLENRCVELLGLAENVKPPVGTEKFRGMMDFFGKCCGQDIWTLPILAAWLRDEKYEHLLWRLTKIVTQGEEGWKG